MTTDERFKRIEREINKIIEELKNRDSFIWTDVAVFEYENALEIVRKYAPKPRRRKTK